MEDSASMGVYESERRDSPNDPANRTPDSPNASRHSPAPPLAPLEYLQNQRRGSITDPSLHAASPNPQTQNNNQGNNSSSAQFRQQDLPHPGQGYTSPTPPDGQSKNAPRPVSPFIFGDASAHNTRRLLRSSSSDRGNGASSNNSGENPQKSQESTGSMSGPPDQNGQGAARRGGTDEMETDANDKSVSRRASEVGSGSASGDPSSFDYNMRRQMMGAGESGRSTRPEDGPLGQPRGGPLAPPSQAGQKRKMSSDRAAFPNTGEEIDPQLVGPGVHSSMSVDPEGPAPKRRGSAFDTQRIAQLSLYDRRESVDSRAGSGPTWWGNDRRDSTSSMFSSTSLGSSVGYPSPGFSGDSHGRPAGGMAAFAWPPTAGPADSATAGMHEDVDSNIGRQFEAPVAPHSIVTNMHYDRRMSVPDSVSASSRPERVLRSRSRPPSRAAAGGSRMSEAPLSNLPSLPPSGGNNNQDDPPSATSSQGSSLQAGKDGGNTPYSRSPELRVSHKLAERKRRKEMKDLFDELRDHLPADRGMKASKWEILSKAIDFIAQMKQTHGDMVREIEMLRHEVESVRHGVPFGHPGGPPHPVVYGQPPPIPQYPPPGGAPQVQQPHSRPGSSQNAFPPNAGPPPANGKS